MNLQEFGHRLRTLRTTAGYTQDQLIDVLQLLVVPEPNGAYRVTDMRLHAPLDQLLCRATEPGYLFNSIGKYKIREVDIKFAGNFEPFQRCAKLK